MALSGSGQDLQSKRTLVVKIATEQIGVRELTNHNDGTKVEMYLKSVGLGKGYAWCAAFLRWTFDSAHVHTTINGAAASAHNKAHLVYYGHKWLQEPVASDVFCIYSRKEQRICHTGFYSGWANRSEGTFLTTEGNTNTNGSSNGDGCYRRIRQAGSIYSISRWIN